MSEIRVRANTPDPLRPFVPLSETTNALVFEEKRTVYAERLVIQESLADSFNRKAALYEKLPPGSRPKEKTIKKVQDREQTRMLPWAFEHPPVASPRGIFSHAEMLAIRPFGSKGVHVALRGTPATARPENQGDQTRLITWSSWCWKKLGRWIGVITPIPIPRPRKRYEPRERGQLAQPELRLFRPSPLREVEFPPIAPPPVPEWSPFDIMECQGTPSVIGPDPDEERTGALIRRQPALVPMPIPRLPGTRRKVWPRVAPILPFEPLPPAPRSLLRFELLREDDEPEVIAPVVEEPPVVPVPPPAIYDGIIAKPYAVLDLMDPDEEATMGGGTPMKLPPVADPELPNTGVLKRAKYPPRFRVKFPMLPNPNRKWPRGKFIPKEPRPPCPPSRLRFEVPQDL